jgi:hypothetical protein
VISQFAVIGFAAPSDPDSYTPITDRDNWTGEIMDRKLGRKRKETTLAESSVTIKLLSIQQRCKDLLNDPDQTLELALEEPAPWVNRGFNPYEPA